MVVVPRKTSIFFDEEDESLSMLEDQIVEKQPPKFEKSQSMQEPPKTSAWNEFNAAAGN